MSTKTLALALLCTGLLALSGCASNAGSGAAPAASEAAAAPTPMVEVTANSLNVRAQPDANGTVLGSVKRGQRVAAPQPASDGWLFVELDSGVSGYVASQYVRSVEAAPAAAHAAQPAESSATRDAAKPDYTPAPGSKLARVTPGMTSSEVVELLGAPTSEKNYITGKAFIPYYYGSDTSRVDFKYAGLGRVVMTRNQYSGNLKVVRVEADASETGH